MEGNSVERGWERRRDCEKEREEEVEGKIGATFSRKGRAGRNERWGKTEGERQGREREKTERKREKRWRAGCHGEEKRMENGWLRQRMDRAGNFWGRLTTSQLKEDTRAFFSVLDDVFRVSYLTLTLPERIFYRGKARLYLVHKINRIVWARNFVHETLLLHINHAQVILAIMCATNVRRSWDRRDSREAKRKN